VKWIKVLYQAEFPSEKLFLVQAMDGVPDPVHFFRSPRHLEFLRALGLRDPSFRLTV
jgi:hypothetical protein